MMRSIFQPCLYIEKIDELPSSELLKRGYKNILIDLDNTLAPYDQKTIDENSVKILDDLKSSGFNVVVISNNSFKRVRTFLKNTDYQYLDFALKPTKIGFKRLLKRYGYKIEETIMIGDQILTDVVGANRMGIYSVLVKQLSVKDSLSTKVNRLFEKYLIKRGKVVLK